MTRCTDSEDGRNPTTCEADAQERIVALHIQPKAAYRDSAEGVIDTRLKTSRRKAGQAIKRYLGQRTLLLRMAGSMVPVRHLNRSAPSLGGFRLGITGGKLGVPHVRRKRKFG
jgi:hypothetical protein